MSLPPRLRRLGLRRLGRAAYVVYGAAVIGLVMGALWIAMVFTRRPARAIALQRAASRLMMACLGCRLVVRGAWPDAGAHVGAYVGACVFVANHTSYLDIPLMLAAVERDFAFVTKSELLHWPLISLITRAGAHIPVDRERLESRGAVVGRIVKALRAGRSVVLFPEGTFSHDDRLRPFQAGAFKSALAAGVPVVPIALEGVAKLWSQHARFPSPGVVTIWVGPALEAATDGDEAARLAALRDGAVRFIASHAGLPASPD
jgi:1-acyl-sn-glycerol-3-phosphate acyltransferase